MWKIPKGSMDLTGDVYSCTQNLLNKIEKEFKRNGGQPLDTPVFERTDVLLGKYGDEADTKLIYKIEENGGEPLALRYDLTIPFVRYIKENKIKTMRRYSIGKVYRRDQPTIAQGRFREFYQADFDIVGETQDSMIAEGLLLKMACKILDDYKIEYKVLVNDVSNVKTMIQDALGYQNWKVLCPIIDKLDKKRFDDLIPEFLSVDSNLDIDKLRTIVKSSEIYNQETKCNFDKLQKYSNAFGFNLTFSNSLVRGLDYYTGFIWEIKTIGSQSSIISGGRYDTLLGVPAVGISFGVSRMVSLLDLYKETQKERTYFVTTVGDVSLDEKISIIAKLETLYPDAIIMYSLSQEPKKLGKVLSTCKDMCVIIAADELRDGYIIIKDMKSSTQEKVKI
jgi:histidyl-tRNA synthetase